jgi:Carboxypeptidase regulatory-like domain/Dockerin type I domain
MRSLICRIALVTALAVFGLLGTGNVRAEEGGSIAGTVLDATGSPLEGCEVAAYSEGGPGTDYTDEDGFYQIDLLAVGDYVVYATCYTETGDIVGYYDGASTPEDATLVHVSAEQTTSNIDFVLGGAISGTVTGVLGNPLEGCAVVALPDSIENAASVALTDTAGYYALRTLIPDTYEILAACDGYVAEYYNDALDEPAADHVSVIDEQNTSIDFELDLLGDTNGDDQVSMLDAMLAAQYALRLIGGDGLSVAAADVNCSGTVSMLDAMLIAQKALLLITDFPACGQ